MTGRRGCVEGCEFEAPHAGSHGRPQVPATASCAPARCYCGECPSWVPRADHSRPDPERVAELLEPVRAQLASGLSAAQRRARAERRAREMPWREG